MIHHHATQDSLVVACLKGFLLAHSKGNLHFPPTSQDAIPGEDASTLVRNDVLVLIVIPREHVFVTEESLMRHLR